MSGASTILRFRIMLVLLAVLTAAILVAYARLMLFQEPAAENQGSTAPERGPILDRNGEVLAVQTRLDTVAAWLPDVQSIPEVSAALSRVLKRSEAELSELLRSSSGYVVIERRVTPTQSEQIKELLKENSITGISLRPELGRTYPHKQHAAHVVGYVGTDNTGLGGIEYTLNDTLTGTADRNRAENESVDEEASRYGNQIVLTLDLNIQARMDDIVETALDEHNADSVTLLVMQAKTGELLAYSSAPAFDPNNFQSYTASERSNRPISQIYEPGSVFKVFSISSFLELGGITPDDTFQTNGIYRSEEADFEITDLGNYGNVTAEEIIKYSSNVGAAYASESVGAENFYRMLRLFGFGSETGVRLSGEENGLLRRPSQWSGRTQQTLAIGQEIGVTALQVISAATVFANEGILLRPRIVKRIMAPDGSLIEQYARQPIRRVLSETTTKRMLRYMHEATQPGGTARRIRIDGIEISAKTGTAQVFDNSTQAYSHDAFIASTLALFPTDDPQIAIYVALDHPRGETYYGGRIAAPITREAARFLIPHLGIPRSTDSVLEHSGVIHASTPSLPSFENTLPDFSGLPKRKLLPLLERDDIRIRLNGSGWVVSQSPPPGTTIRENMLVTLELE